MPETDHCCHARLSRGGWHDHDPSCNHPVGTDSLLYVPRHILILGCSIAYEKGKYGFVFGRRGIVMESCSSYFLPRLIGHSNASYLVSTGGVFPPNSKHFGDLFNEILPEPSQVLPRALELATEIADHVSPTSQHLNRALLWRDTGSAEAAHLVESKMIFHTFGSAYVAFSSRSIACTDDIIVTRRKAWHHSLRNASPTSGRTWTTTRRQPFPGGPMLILDGIPKQRFRNA